MFMKILEVLSVGVGLSVVSDYVVNQISFENLSYVNKEFSLFSQDILPNKTL